MAKRRRREYLQYLDAAKVALEVGIDAFNCVWHPYRDEATLLLLTNSWELLAKAVLLHDKESILRGQRGETISAEMTVHKLVSKKHLPQVQADTVQQVISLRNAACHGILPPVPQEVMQHLLFYSCKFFRTLVTNIFPGHLKDMKDNVQDCIRSAHGGAPTRVQGRRSPPQRQEREQSGYNLLN